MTGNGVRERGDVRTLGRRLLLAVDAKGYGGADAVRQGDFQEAIKRLLGEAAEHAGLNREWWMTQEGGDSLFAVLPADASESALVDPFMRRLDTGLRAFNRDRVPEARLRLRAAVHCGLVSYGANGFVCRAPVVVGRIRDCAALRDALVAAPDAYLAVGLSTAAHEVVAEGDTTFRAQEFRRVSVTEKEYSGDAWIWVPVPDTEQPRREPEPPSRHDAPVVRAGVNAKKVDGRVTVVRTDKATGTIEATAESEHIGPTGEVVGVEIRTTDDGDPR
ncbi:hypothetical protein [Streptomyces sp. 4R-3d]|uniref:hypothetical protein n=1 Tax=Streptomyces sp. 4R-3d TaxID=2559605 RepID=UPI00107266B6|nr:hypothetical protein [Streptomyces sp. 4R-3d]TFI25614.1 hypothetical protein E4P36_19495 [Streptomyces sp. 4R-3d]